MPSTSDKRGSCIKYFSQKHKLYFCRTEILYLLMSALYFRLIFSFPNILRVMSHEINEPPRQRRQWFSISCLQKQQIMIIIVHLGRLIANSRQHTVSSKCSSSSSSCCNFFLQSSLKTPLSPANAHHHHHFSSILQNSFKMPRLPD